MPILVPLRMKSEFDWAQGAGSSDSQTRLADLEAANDNGGQKPQDIDPIQVDLLLGKAYSDWGHISDAVSVYDKLINEHPEDFRGYLAKAKFFAPEAAKALVDRYAQR
ncbi:hypothetical protein C2845_PM03G25450 [Panicum miliaceum]|uniref:Uncharacterized protein n=1 Tax=Panicum miliaceum TaxID=4540 RepID=A0A3L6TF75_PANMI|nr:hypothetical protein C2845_PM03G25450 [Panicum miliaceum]